MVSHPLNSRKYRQARYWPKGWMAGILILMFGVWSGGGGSVACRKPVVDVFGTPADTPVVYAFLDPGDSLHQIMLFRSVLEPSLPLSDQFSSPENVFALDWQVEILWNGQRFEGVLDTLFEPFMQIPFRIVRVIPARLSYGETITLNVRDETGKVVASATLPLLADLIYSSPSPIDTSTPIDFFSWKPLVLVWQSVARAYAYAVQMEFLFSRDTSGTGGWKQERVVLTILPFYVPEGTGTYVYTYRVEDFYQALASAIQNFPADQVKRVDGFHIRFWAISRELYDYLRSVRVQAYSLAGGGEILPVYSNVQGGVGIVASRVLKRTSRYRFSNSTIDSLACHPRLLPYDFLKSSGFLCTP